jgi:hypothetical protein
MLAVGEIQSMAAGGRAAVLPFSAKKVIVCEQALPGIPHTVGGTFFAKKGSAREYLCGKSKPGDGRGAGGRKQSGIPRRNIPNRNGGPPGPEYRRSKCRPAAIRSKRRYILICPYPENKPPGGGCAGGFYRLFSPPRAPPVPRLGMNDISFIPI